MTKAAFSYAQWVIAWTVMITLISVGLIIVKNIYTNGLPKKWMHSISSAVLQNRS